MRTCQIELTGMEEQQKEWIIFFTIMYIKYSILVSKRQNLIHQRVYEFQKKHLTALYAKWSYPSRL